MGSDVSDINFLLFTTYDAQGHRVAELVRLLTSVQQASRDDGLNIRHYVLLQRTASVPQEVLGFDSDTFVFMCADRQLSLARARNLMIHRARRNGLLARAEICAFPDDDAWYPDGVLHAFHRMFQADGDIGIAVCRYGSSPSTARDPAKFVASFTRTQSCFAYLKRVASITLFLRSSLAQSVGYFDERLGVGAPINGGEDTDYALRAYCSSRMKVVLADDMYMGHRDRLPANYPKYFAGGLFAIARSAPRSACITVQMVRRICIGAYLVLTGRMSLAHCLTGLRIGLAGFGQKEVRATPFE
jgi:hypothetical protein